MKSAVFKSLEFNKIQKGSPCHISHINYSDCLILSLDQFDLFRCHDLSLVTILMCLLSSCCCGCQTLEQGLFIFGVFDILIRFTTHNICPITYLIIIPADL